MKRFIVLLLVCGWGLYASAQIKWGGYQYNDVNNPNNDDSLIISFWINHLNNNSFFIEPDVETYDSLKNRYPNLRGLAYLSFTTMYNKNAHQSTLTNCNQVFLKEALCDVNRDSIQRAWCVSKGLSLYQRQDMFLHWLYNWRGGLVYSPLTRYHFEAWADANDANTDGRRDKKAYFGTAQRTGLNYLVSSTVTGVNTAGMGVYINIGLSISLVDTATGQSGDSVYWNAGDTTNTVLKPGFETGFSPQWLTYSDSTNFMIPSSNARIISGDSSRGLTNNAGGVNYIQQKGLMIKNATPVRFRVKYRTNSTHVKLTLRKGSDFNYVMYEFVPTVTDMSIQQLDTLIPAGNIVEDSAQVMLGFELGGATTESLYVDDIVLYSRFGFLASDSMFVIDTLSVSAHYATALYESLATARFYEIQRELPNVGDTNYRKFMKAFTPDYCLTYRKTPNNNTYSGIMLDEWASFVPSDARYKTKEYDTTVASDSFYYEAYKATVDYVNDTTTQRNLLIITNRQNDTVALRLCDGQYAEGIGTWEYPITISKDSMWLGTGYYQGGSYQVNIYAYRFYKNTIAQFKNVKNLYPNKKHIYEYRHDGLTKSDDSNQSYVSALAQYLIFAKGIVGDSTWFFFSVESQPLTYDKYWDFNWNENWGTPTDTPYVFQSGTVGALPYFVVAQKYYLTTGDSMLALYIPRCDTSIVLADTNTITVNLGANYFNFTRNGRFKSSGTTVALGYNRGVILIKANCQ